MLPIAQLNVLRRDEFAHALSPLFEAATPLANALYAQRPFTSYAQLIDTAESLALTMPLTQQIEVLAAHPRIGAPVETLSAASKREQAFGTQPADEVLAELAALNAEYEDRFGFRFVVFVHNRPRSEIVEVLRARLENSRDIELDTGLTEMFRIARDRLASSA
jgi:OHCU decarboxylase